jgi:hypothetical protein
MIGTPIADWTSSAVLEQQHQEHSIAMVGTSTAENIANCRVDGSTRDNWNIKGCQQQGRQFDIVINDILAVEIKHFSLSLQLMSTISYITPPPPHPPLCFCDSYFINQRCYLTTERGGGVSHLEMYIFGGVFYL